jgi:hypothetical protein
MPTITQPRQPRQPRESFTLGHGVCLAAKQDIDVANGWIGRRRQKIATQSEQTRRNRVQHACLMKSLDARQVGEDSIAQWQLMPILMPQQMPITGKTYERDRRLPEVVRNDRIGQPQCNEVRHPSAGKSLAQIVPGIRWPHRKIASRTAKSQAVACLSNGVEVLSGERTMDGSEKMAEHFILG